MKGMCFLIITFALILSYQKNPFGTIIVGGIGFLIYAFFKLRKRSTGTRRGWVFNKGISPQHSQMEDLINLLVIQSFLKNGIEPDGKKERPEPSSKFQELEAMKKEILSLFDEV
jgi:hypothetical protein